MRRIVPVLLYPLFAIGVTMAILVFLTNGVIAEFDSIFSEFGLTLPAPTRFLLAVSRPLRLDSPHAMVRIIAWSTVGWLAISGLGYVLIRRRTAGLPTGIRDAATWATFCREANAELKSGATREDAIRRAAKRCGETRSPTTIDEQAFPPVVRFALGIGEPREPSLPLLRSLSQNYSDHAQAEQTFWAAIPLPIILQILIGLLIAFVVVSLFMPMVSLISGLS